MSKILDTLVRELDPRHDLDRYRNLDLYSDRMSPEHKKNEIRNLAIMAFVNNPKSLTRGGIAGSTLGSLAGIAYALVSNQPISEGVMIVGALSGGAVGAGLDSFVHLIRYTAKFL